MRYRLKDKELQQKLDELSDGDFSKQLALNAFLNIGNVLLGESPLGDSRCFWR